jgi:succinate dehydrogenase / fumarate reductase flavoprotein subunit
VEFGLRVADYMEFSEMMVRDALDRNESCGCHFREEYQTDEGECLRNDKDYSYVAAWEYTGPGKDPILHKEDLEFENVELKQRSYK